jgi:hypothetical protein
MDKIKSILTKGKTVLTDGLDPYEEGKKNFNDGVGIDKKKLDICRGCKHFKEEPVDFLRVEDKDVPELSGKMCGACGCTLSYKIRQNIKPCKEWLK